MNAAINFVIKANGSVKGMTEYVAERANGELLATISPRLQFNGSYSTRFLNVCTLDGKVEIADGIEHADEIIAAKFFN